jgi:hypothetical protein
MITTEAIKELVWWGVFLLFCGISLFVCAFGFRMSPGSMFYVGMGAVFGGVIMRIAGEALRK